MGVVRVVNKAGGSRPSHLRKVPPRGGPGGATLWVGNLGVDSSDAAKVYGAKYGFPTSSDRDEGSKAEEQDLAKGGGV